MVQGAHHEDPRTAHPSLRHASEVSGPQLQLALGMKALHIYSQQREPELLVKTDKNPITAVGFSREHGLVLTVSGRSIQTWSAIVGVLINVYRDLAPSPITCLAMDKRGVSFAIGCECGAVQTHNVASGHTIRILRSHGRPVQGVAWVRRQVISVSTEEFMAHHPCHPILSESNSGGKESDADEIAPAEMTRDSTPMTHGLPRSLASVRPHGSSHEKNVLGASSRTPDKVRRGVIFLHSARNGKGAHPDNHTVLASGSARPTDEITAVVGIEAEVLVQDLVVVGDASGTLNAY